MNKMSEGVANWATAEAASMSNDMKRNIAIMISTIPEALPVGVLFLSLILMDKAFAMFGTGLVLTSILGGILRSRGTPPTGYSASQCSPWNAQATLRAVAQSVAELQSGGTKSSMWVSASLLIITFACAYIITSVKLLQSSFDTRIATYAEATVPAASIACGATLAGFLCFRFFTGCENMKSIAMSLAIGCGLGVGWAFAAYAIEPELVNIVHIPRSTGVGDTTLTLCSA
jgi:hypothetical protein